MDKVTIVIPTYNEADNVDYLIPSIFNLLPQISIVIVDDNSNDGTLQKIANLQKKNNRLFLIKREKKSGRGSAVINGMKYAYEKLKADKYIEMDADLSHDPSELTLLIKKINKKTVTCASRYIKGSKIINWPLSRRVASKISNILVRFFLSIPMHDNTNGYRGYSREAARYLINHYYLSSGYIVLAEMAFLLKNKGFDFFEIQTVFNNRRAGRSNTTVQEFTNALITLFRIWYNNFSASK